MKKQIFYADQCHANAKEDYLKYLLTAYLFDAIYINFEIFLKEIEKKQKKDIVSLTCKE